VVREVDHINPGDELKIQKVPVLLIHFTDDLFALLPLGLLVAVRVAVLFLWLKISSDLRGKLILTVDYSTGSMMENTIMISQMFFWKES
jgi:hypothetical protein